MEKYVLANKGNISKIIDSIVCDINPDTDGIIIFKNIKLNNLSNILNSSEIKFIASLPLIITKNHIYLCIRKCGLLKGNYHNLGKKTFIKAIKSLNNPNIVFKDKESIVVVVDIKDSHNNDIIIPMRLKENLLNSTIEVNIIQSVYGKRNFRSFVKNKEIIYIKK